MPSSNTSPRVLIVRVGAMGDILHALPAVAALRRALPACEIGWAIEPRWRPLLESSTGHRPLVTTLHPAETRLWKQAPLSRATLQSLLTLRTSLQARRYTHAVDLQGSLRSATIGWLARAGTLAGSSSPRETPARILYQHRISTTAPHVVDQAADLLGTALGLALKPAPVDLPNDPATDLWASSLLPLNRRPVLLVPQAGWGAKQWPPDHFAALARALAAHGYTPLVNATGPADPLSNAVVQAAAGAATPIHADLPQLIALTRRMLLVVAGDTGPLHLAAALGRPVVALFGPTDPARTGPYSTLARTFRHSASLTDHRRHAATEPGLAQLAVEPVLAAALDLLGIGDNIPMHAPTPTPHQEPA